MQEAGFAAGDRASIIMTNQSKWLISAYAIFFAGGVLVPLDYKLTPAEHWQLLKHSGAKILITEYPIWRQLAASPGRAEATNLRTVLVTEAPPNADLAGALRWEEFRVRQASANVHPARTQRHRLHRLFLRHRRPPKGCMLTHDNYLEQCVALTSLYPFWPGVRYLSILPTNHAIDFMVGFFGPFICGATVVHLRTLRPEYVREAFHEIQDHLREPRSARLEKSTKGIAGDDSMRCRRANARFSTRWSAMNKALHKEPSRLWLSRLLLKQVHEAFGGELRAIIVGGAFTEPQTLQFFYDLGIPVANGYGLTEAGTAITVNDLKPFRADTVGKPLPGMEVASSNPAADGIGEVSVRSKTVMSGYLNDPELTAETIVDGWLMTGDLGRFDQHGPLAAHRPQEKHDRHRGRKKYLSRKTSKRSFESLPVKEFCVFAANYIWPKRSMVGEQLVLVLHLEAGPAIIDEAARQRHHRAQQSPAELQARSRGRSLRTRISRARLP